MKYIKTAVHCKTEEESLQVNKKIVEDGGENLHRNYTTYKENTCYHIGDNTYGRLIWFQDNEYTIISASEFLNPIYEIY